MMKSSCLYCRQCRTIGLLVLRLVVATAFIYHGMQKWGLWSGVPEGMSSGMVTLMKVLSICEPLAGVALILGLLTPVAVIGLLVVMISAMYMKISGGSPFAMWEIDFLLFGSLVALLTNGPGKFSLDQLLCWRTCSANCGDCKCGADCKDGKCGDGCKDCKDGACKC